MMNHDVDGLGGEESDEMLMALADGELPEPQSTQLLARIAANPDLAARYALFTDTRAFVQEAYAPGPVPDALVQAILDAPTSNVVALPARRPVWAGMALAASLVLAVGLGGFFAGQGFGPGPQAAADPARDAARLLATTLTGGSAAQPDGGSARVLASYQTDLGLCRLIALEFASGGAERAMVCQEGTDWAVALSVIAGTEEAYLPASETATALIDTFLDGFKASAPLEAEAEAAALGQ